MFSNEKPNTVAPKRQLAACMFIRWAMINTIGLARGTKQRPWHLHLHGHVLWAQYSTRVPDWTYWIGIAYRKGTRAVATARESGPSRGARCQRPRHACIYTVDDPRPNLLDASTVQHLSLKWSNPFQEFHFEPSLPQQAWTRFFPDATHFETACSVHVLL
jgi:hypothetical protein